MELLSLGKGEISPSLYSACSSGHSLGLAEVLGVLLLWEVHFREENEGN